MINCIPAVFKPEIFQIEVKRVAVWAKLFGRKEVMNSA
jgi:hypothetical protein